MEMRDISVQQGAEPWKPAFGNSALDLAPVSWKPAGWLRDPQFPTLCAAGEERNRPLHHVIYRLHTCLRSGLCAGACRALRYTIIRTARQHICGHGSPKTQATVRESCVSVPLAHEVPPASWTAERKKHKQAHGWAFFGVIEAQDALDKATRREAAV